MDFLKNNLKVNIVITILVFLTVNCLHLFYVKDLKNGVQKGNYYDYEFNIYIKPSKMIFQFNRFFNENFKTNFIDQKYLRAGPRADIAIYLEDMKELIESSGFTEMTLKNQASPLFFYNIILNFKDKSFNEDFNFDKNLEKKIIDRVLILENKIIEKNLEFINLDYILKEMTDKLNDDLEFRENNKIYYSSDDKTSKDIDEFKFKKDFRYRHQTLKTLEKYNNYFSENPEKYLMFDQSSIKKEIIDADKVFKRDLDRVNLINLNFGALILSVIIILFYDVFKYTVRKT